MTRLKWHFNEPRKFSSIFFSKLIYKIFVYHHEMKILRSLCHINRRQPILLDSENDTHLDSTISTNKVRGFKICSRKQLLSSSCILKVY